MSLQRKTPPPPHGPIHPSPPADGGKLRQEAESKEVAGRHKNTGQKDHKGAR